MTNNLPHHLNNHGLRLLANNQLDSAQAFFLDALAHDPDYADAYCNLGLALLLQQKFNDAVIILSKALELRPDHPETLFNYGHSLWNAGELLPALKAFERTIALADTVQAHLSMGMICRLLAYDEDAIYHLRMVLQREPDNLKASETLCEVLHYRGVEYDAMAACDDLLKLNPAFRFKRSLIMLTYDNKSGWDEYEWCDAERANAGSNIVRAANEDPYWFCKLFDKKWNGQPTGHLLVICEQGLGDSIQFMRFIPFAAERCSKLSVFLPVGLRGIARRSFTQDNIEICEKVPHDFDHYCLMMSLAPLLDRIDDIPPCPYLVSSHIMNHRERLQVGLAWSGGKQHPDDHWRSVPFQQIEKIFDLPVDFISLQYPEEIDLPIIQVPLNDDWSVTAAVIDGLDLIISVDTAVAHMAGALNKPVWLMNRYNTDWRWMLHRSDTPWYPSMRIFRQSKLGDWGIVMADIRIALNILIEETNTHAQTR